MVAALILNQTLSQLPSWQAGSRNYSLVMNVNKSIPDRFGPCLDTSSNCWSLLEHHYAEVHAVCMPTQTEDPPLWSGLLSSSTRAAAFRENRGDCLNCHKGSHSLSQGRHLFQNLGGLLNPDLGALGHDGEASRCRLKVMIRRRRQNKITTGQTQSE